jgi:hypothetical protein
MNDELPPYSPYNNARAYHIRKLESFAKSPSFSKAQELEQLGYCLDFDEVSTGADLCFPSYQK